MVFDVRPCINKTTNKHGLSHEEQNHDYQHQTPHQMLSRLWRLIVLFANECLFLIVIIIHVIIFMISQTLVVQLTSNTNHPDIKQSIADKVTNIQNAVYKSMTEQTNTFLNLYALRIVDQQRFKTIQMLTQRRSLNVIDSIQNGQLEIVLPQTQIKNEAEVSQKQQHPRKLSVTIDVDKYKYDELPIMQNHEYWSYKHNKSLEVKEYVKQLHQRQLKYKRELEEKRKAIQDKKNAKFNQMVSEQSKAEQQKKKQLKEAMIKKIQQIEQGAKQRNQRQQYCKQFYKSLKQKKKLFERIEQNFKRTIEIPLLEERKHRLQQIRSIRQTPTIEQIQQHTAKFDAILQSKRENAEPIYNSPVKVRFKSRYHEEMSRLNHSEQNMLKQLYQKKVNYGKIVKENFKPNVSERLVKEIESRLKDKKKKRKHKKKEGQEEDSSQSESSQEEQQPQQDEDDEEDEEGGKKQKKIRSENMIRNQIGRSYLQYMKNLPKPSKQERIRMKQEQQKAEAERSAQEIQKNKKKNYLQQIRNNRSFSLTKKNHFQDWQQDLRDPTLKQIQKKRRIVMKSEMLNQKAAMRELQLQLQRLPQEQLLAQKDKVDGQYIEAIKAKIAAMKV